MQAANLKYVWGKQTRFQALQFLSIIQSAEAVL